MKRIRFTADAEYKCIPGPVFYRAGSVHELRDDLAARWIRRSVAVELPPAPFAEVVSAMIQADDGGPIISTEAQVTAPAGQVFASLSGGVLTLSTEESEIDETPLTEAELDAAEAELAAVVAEIPPPIPTAPNKPRRGRPSKRVAR